VLPPDFFWCLLVFAVGAPNGQRCLLVIQIGAQEKARHFGKNGGLYFLALPYGFMSS
jgi:hypothetical protein